MRNKSPATQDGPWDFAAIASPNAEGGLGAMVRPERLELPTLCSEGRCSIQLSYGRTTTFYGKGEDSALN
jgi:hypothetical protein